MFEIFITELIKNINEKSKDLYFDKLQEIKTRVSDNKLIFFLFKYLRNIFVKLFAILSEGNEEENENLNRTRVMSISHPFHFTKTIRKNFKLPKFTKVIFYPLACIDALTKELEVNLFKSFFFF